VQAVISESPATGAASKVDAEAVWKDERECIVGTYGRGDTPVFTHGLGCKMWDSEGNEYLAGRNSPSPHCLQPRCQLS
jgi:acetylornithine aminotransferase